MKKLNIKDIRNGMSRNEMRAVKGGCGNCGDSCTIGGNQCAQYGLTCGFHYIVNGGVITSSCNKCM